jgi:hypothetical protein
MPKHVMEELGLYKKDIIQFCILNELNKADNNAGRLAKKITETTPYLLREHS